MPHKESRACPLTPLTPSTLPSPVGVPLVGTLCATRPHHPHSPPPPPKPAHLHYLNPRAILHPRHPTSYLGAQHRKGTKEHYETHQPDQLTSHPGAARPPGLRHAPPPLTLSSRRWKVHRLSAAHLSSRSTPRLRPLIRASSSRHVRGALPRLCRVPRGHRAPGLLRCLSSRRFPFTQRR